MTDRRTTLKALAAATGSLAGTLPGISPAAEPGERTLLQETEPSAKAIGYIANAAKVDVQANPGYKRGQSCTTCAFVELTSARQRGCSLVPGRLVMAVGWCKLWKLRGSV